MAGEATISILAQLKDEVSGKLSGLSNNIKQNAESYKKLGAGLAAVAAGGVLAMKGWVDAANTQIEAETRLAQIARQVTGASDEQIASVKALASEQQKLGIIGDEVTIMGQSQLASYGLNTDAIKKLTPSLNDLIVSQKGFSATGGDAVAAADKFGKVLLGDIGALKDAGISFSELQAEMLKNGTEAEKLSTLIEVLQGNYGGLNEAMRNTTAGAMAAFKNSLGDLQEQLGMALLPFINKVTDGLQRLADFMLELPAPVKTVIAGVALAATAFAALAAPILLIMGFLPQIIAGFTILTGAMLPVVGTVGLVVAAIVALGAAYATNFMGIRTATADLFAYLSEKFGEFLDIVLPPIQELATLALETWNKIAEDWRLFILVYQKEIKAGLDALKAIFSIFTQLLGGIFAAAWEGIRLYFVVAWEVFSGIVKASLLLLQGDWSGAWDAIKGIFVNVWDEMKDFVRGAIDGIIGFVDSLISKITSAISAVKALIGLDSSSGATTGGGGRGLSGRRAKGGSVLANQAYLVGEQRPEIFVPNSAGRIIPQVGGGGSTTVIQNSGNVYLSEDVAEMLNDMMIKKLSFNTRF